MAKNLNEITTIVKDYIDDTTITVDQHAIDAVNFLSNIFFIPSIDESISIVVDQDYIAVPTLSVKVNQVFVAGVEIPPVDDLAKLDVIRQENTQRWYEYHGRIQFTQAHTAVSATKIWYNKGFIEPEAAVDTNVPERLLELVYIGATYRYYGKLLSKVLLNRQDYPDSKPGELRDLRDSWREQYQELIREIKAYGQAV